MNAVLKQIVAAVSWALAEYLPDVTPEMLEGSGTIYYMNGRNGTEFEWFVNEHLPAFMVFYADDENLGAAKVHVYTDGALLIYLYADGGKTLAHEVETALETNEEELLQLAASLRCNADDKRMWDAPIEEIDTDTTPSAESMRTFLDTKQFLEPSIRRRQLLEKLAVVSRQITEGHWRVGYMSRDELHDEEDSGWLFYAANEDDAYLDDIANFSLCAIGQIAQIDPAILGYIDSEIGTNLIRTSATEFEPDQGQEPYLEKW